MSHLRRLTCALTLSVLPLAAQSVPIPASEETTGMIGLADSQTARLNLLNPGVLPPAIGVVCSANVSFVDDTGTVLKSTSLVIPPGKSMHFDLRSDTDLQLVAGDRRELRAVFAIPSVLPPTPAATTPSTPAPCKLIPTLEIYDTVSGRTLVTLGRAVEVPSVTATPAP